MPLPYCSSSSDGASTSDGTSDGATCDSPSCDAPGQVKKGGTSDGSSDGNSGSASSGKGEGKGERELGAVVHLDFSNGKREHLPDRGQEVETGAVILAGIEAQDPIARAVIQGGILRTFLPRHLHLLHIDLDTLTRLFLAEEDRRPGAPRGCTAAAPPRWFREWSGAFGACRWGVGREQGRERNTRRRRTLRGGVADGSRS